MRTLIYSLLSLFILMGCHTEESPTKKVEKVEKVKTYYTCSMHPKVKQDKPGQCPLCGMALTKIESEESDHAHHHHDEGGAKKVRLRKGQVQHFRADLFKVTRMKMQKEIRLLGSVLKSEEKRSNIPAQFPGRVEEVLIQSTGSFVKKGDAVLKLYAPKLLATGEEYLIARKNYLSQKTNRDLKDLYEQTRERLKQWGILDKQIKEWEEKGSITREITIYSDVTGIVEKKNAVNGKYFKEGESYFDLVDLSHVWVELDVYEHDSALVGLGQTVKLEFNAYPGDFWQGKIDFVSPILDSKSRTLKIRTTLDNKLGKLKPGMVGSAELLVELDSRPLVIPRSAIIDTGRKKVVWLKEDERNYFSKEVKTGFESQGHVEIKDGLSLGEEVVREGNFLLDAQAKLFGDYDDE